MKTFNLLIICACLLVGLFAFTAAKPVLSDGEVEEPRRRRESQTGLTELEKSEDEEAADKVVMRGGCFCGYVNVRKCNGNFCYYVRVRKCWGSCRSKRSLEESPAEEAQEFPEATDVAEDKEAAEKVVMRGGCFCGYVNVRKCNGNFCYYVRVRKCWGSCRSERSLEESPAEEAKEAQESPEATDDTNTDVAKDEEAADKVVMRGGCFCGYVNVRKCNGNFCYYVRVRKCWGSC